MIQSSPNRLVAISTTQELGSRLTDSRPKNISANPNPKADTDPTNDAGFCQVRRLLDGSQVPFTPRNTAT